MTKEFVVPIYNTTVRIVIGNAEETEGYLQKLFDEYLASKIMEDLNLPDCDGKVADLEDNSHLLWLPNTPITLQENGTLAHEIFHLAVSILINRGIPLNEDTEETVAYLIGYLTKKILPITR